MTAKKETTPKAEINAGVQNGESTQPDEVKKEKTGLAGDIQTKRALYDKQKELEAKDEEIAKLKAQLGTPAVVPVPAVTSADLFAQMEARINELSRQVVSGVRGEKTLFRSATPQDLQDDDVTFTSRSVFFVVGSYMDRNGLEQIPPHKLIIFTYQASDIRKDGKEETIKNFSQFSTRLKTEIAFLRSHPHYGITFSENTNEMMDEDTRDTQFKVRAANQLSTLPPEAIYERAKEYKIANWQSKNAEELRYQIVHKMAEEYKLEAKKLSEDIIRRRILASSLITEKNSDQ